MTPRQIVVGVDGSREAEGALRWAIETARRDKARITAVHVFEPPMLPIPGFAERIGDLFEAEWREPLFRLLENDWCAPLRVAGLEYEVLLVDGPVGRTLVRLAEDREADAIVIGTNRGLLHGLTIRGVANDVLRHATLPVVVVPSVPEPDLPG